jgi:hypothetical protein
VGPHIKIRVYGVILCVWSARVWGVVFPIKLDLVVTGMAGKFSDTDLDNIQKCIPGGIQQKELDGVVSVSLLVVCSPSWVPGRGGGGV